MRSLRTTLAVVWAISACGIAEPIDLSECFEGARIEVGALPATEEAREALLTALAFERAIPEGYDCARWEVYGPGGVAIGYVRLFVVSRKTECWLLC